MTKNITMKPRTLSYYYKAIIDYQRSDFISDAVKYLDILESGAKSGNHLHAKFCQFAIDKFAEELFKE